MKSIAKGLLAALFSLPLFAYSADTTETYTYALNKLKANPDNYNWLQERSVEGVEFASMVLCLIKATGADLGTQINKGPYLATVTLGSCEKNSTPSTSSDSSGASTGTMYEYFVMNSTSDGTNLDVKLWIPYNKDVDTDKQKKEIRARFIFPLNRSGSDIGFSEMYFKGLTTDDAGNILSNTPMFYGFMKPETISNGYKIIHAERANWGSGEQENWTNLTRTGTGSNVTLSGWTQSSIWSNSDGKDMPATFVVAANQNEILRQQTFKGVTTAPICFNRNSSKFNTWNYNLYDASTGLLVGANSNYQIRYGDYRGNYGGNNFWLPDAALTEIYAKSDKTASITLEDGATTKSATVTANNGGMWKVRKIKTTLEELAGMTFSVWMDNNEKRVFWDKTALRFKLESDSSNVTIPTNWDSMYLNGPGVSYVVRAPKTTGPAPWDANQTTTIPNWSGLTNASVVTYRMETRASETELEALRGQTLTCVANCPMWNASSSDIVSLNANNPSGLVNSMTPKNNGSYYETGKAFQYTYDPDQRKLFNTTVNSASAIEIGGALKTTYNRNLVNKSIYSGALVTTPLNDVVLASRCSWNSNWLCGWDYENSIDQYYYWRSGEHHWEKQWTVKINGVAPTLEDPIMVKYTCPAGRADCTEGSKIILNYNGPGQLWGIPNRCVSADDYTVTVDCNDNTIDRQWLNKFNLTTSPVNANSTTDRVTKVSDSSKAYLVLPQGSGEWYNKKGAGTAADCSVTLPTGTAQPINVDTYYKASMTDIGSPPLNFRTTPVTIQNGVKLR